MDKKQIKRILENYSKRALGIASDKQRAFFLIQKILVKLKNVNLGEAIKDFRLLLNMLQDYFKGNYKNISLYSIVIVIAGFLYFLNPFDILPDFIFGIGYLDDITVLGFVINAISKDVDKYKIWCEKTQQENGYN